MENSNILRDSELGESFSFNSSLAVFSDDDDEDDESYIEIALEPTPTHEEESGDDELDLRISFASTLPFPPQFSAQSFSHEHLRSKSLDNLGTNEIETETKTSSSSSSIGSSSSCSGGDAKTPYPTPQKPMKWRSVQFPQVNRFLNMMVSNLKVSSSETGGDVKNRQFPIHTSHLELVQSRKASKVTRTMNGGMMNLFIKFRSIKIPSMLSFLKTNKLTSPKHNIKHDNRSSEGSPHNYHNQFKPFEKQNQGQRQKQSSNIIKNSFGDGEKSRVLEINLDAIKGVIEAMGMSIGRKGKHTKSCPTSLNSSPIHKGAPSETTQAYTREKSVQAAIAHCKKSFGQTPDSVF